MSEATTTPPAVAYEPAGAWAQRARHVQLALAVLWLLDGGLQFQSFMYSKGFPQMLIGASSGQPGWVVDSVTWAAQPGGLEPDDLQHAVRADPMRAGAVAAVPADGQGWGSPARFSGRRVSGGLANRSGRCSAPSRAR